MHISLAPEVLFKLGFISVTNSLLSAFVIFAVLVAVLFIFSLSVKAFKASKTQHLLEYIVFGLIVMLEGIVHTESVKIISFLITFLFFILFSNLFGLLPFIHSLGFIKTEGVFTSVQNCIKSKDCYFTQSFQVSKAQDFKPLFRAPSSDISFTLALALISVMATNILGFKFLGLAYLKKYINFSSFMAFVVGLMELISEFGKIISFSFRLFGNIFAGEVLLLVITSITFGLATLPFFALEVFVSLVQAFVFFVLTCVFISLAIEKH
ncbi:MAG: F0F1 ATP synthase subunit A [Patescibacteria group bacterium]